MLDFVVAWDKLAQFQSSEEIARFLEGEGIKAYCRNPYSCAISRWMQQTTGNLAITTNSVSMGRYVKDHNEVVTDFIVTDHTPAMSQFVEDFDSHRYPALIQREECEC